EDGIRDFHVTGVQTCALPISSRLSKSRQPLMLAAALFTPKTSVLSESQKSAFATSTLNPRSDTKSFAMTASNEFSNRHGKSWSRSEERRVGKEWGCWW